MNKIKLSYLTIIILLTFMGFILWLFILFILWSMWKVRILGNLELFVIIEALSTALGATAIVGVGYVANKELNETSMSRYLDIANQLFNDLNSEKNILARRWVFLFLPEDVENGLQNMSEEGREAIKTVLNSLDKVAYLTQDGWIPEESIMPWMNPMVVKSWKKLAPYVEYERLRRNEPDYYRLASELANRCIAWRKKNGLNTEITWISNAL